MFSLSHSLFGHEGFIVGCGDVSRPKVSSDGSISQCDIQVLMSNGRTTIITYVVG